jgi:acetate---CoA ligase (ADP-forming)
VAANAEEAVNAAAKIGYPVVVKVDAASILHKSDMGGVVVDLKDGDAVRAAVEKMQQRFSEDKPSFFIQKYLPGGLELIMGAKAEEGLGHAVMFGLGGIFVEIMKDVVFNLTPVSSGEAGQMLSAIKGASMLEGVRGQKGVNQDMVIEIIQRLSQLLTDLPEIQEMDLNPLIAFEDQVVVVDARISL